MQRVLVAGAARGIGLELIKVLAARGDHAIAVCRKSSAELDRHAAQVITGVDFTDPSTMTDLVRQVGAQSLDRLIHNAGILESEVLGEPGWSESLLRQFEVNALGPLRLIHGLLPLLGKGSKVGIVSSRVGSLADNSSGGNYGYRMSKAAVNMAGVNLAHDLRSRGVAVLLLHPGYVRTEMTRGRGDKDAATAARELAALMDRLGMSDTGTFWHAEGYALPW
jgi:NAD(P)-dependent dehydrogenase (short-subunit alcohol dehydrogenase family)